MTTLAQRNFSGGEIAPAFHGRADAARVQAGLATCRNWLIERSGAVANRAGFAYRGQVRATGAGWRLVPSVRDLDTTYLLELGHLYCRVWRGGSPLACAAAPAWSAGVYTRPGAVVGYGGGYWWAKGEAFNATATTLVLAGPLTIVGGGVPNCTLSASVAMFTAANIGQVYVIHDPAGNAAVAQVLSVGGIGAQSTAAVAIIETIQVDSTAPVGQLPPSLDPSAYAAPTTGWSTSVAPVAGAYWYQLSGAVVEFPTPWADADLRALKFAQSIDVMTFCHPAYAPMQLRRSGDFQWELRAVATEIALDAPSGLDAGNANAQGGPFTYRYQYQVTAVDGAGNESDPSAPFGCMNAAPQATGAGGYGNFLSWNAVPGATSYNVYRQASPGSPIYGFVATVDGRAQPPTLPPGGLTVSTGGATPTTPGSLSASGGASGTAADQYLVTAWTAAGQSLAQGAAAVASGAATVGAPVTVAWSAVAGATAYWVYRKAGAQFFLIATLPMATPFPLALASAFTDFGAAIYPAQTPWAILPGAGTATPPDEYLVTAWSAGGQSPAQAVAATSGWVASPSTPITVSWTAVAGATAYWIYRRSAAAAGVNPALFFLVATLPMAVPSPLGLGTSFIDSGPPLYPAQTAWSLLPAGAAPAYQIATQDLIVNPDVAVHPGVPGNAALTTRRAGIFSSANNYPAAVCYFQQRYVFAQTLAQPEYVWMSQAGNYGSFASSFPSEAGDAVIFQVNGYRVNPIRHLVDMGALLLFTDNGVYSVQGGSTGVTPAAISVHQENYVGCQGGVANLAPVIYDNTAIYLQSRGTVVRSIRFDLYTNGYRGDNVSLYAQHLLDGFSVTAWAWAEVPQSTLWVVRSDGVLLAMTYIPEQQICGWSRHDTAQGCFEDVCVIPENADGNGNEDTVYALVRRVIGGVTVRSVERLASRRGNDPARAIFSDCACIYDGRNAGATTLTISGGTVWDGTETLTLSASASAFTPGSGAIFVLHGADGSLVRFTQAAYADSTTVTGTVDGVVPAALRDAATRQWSRGTRTVQAAPLADQAVAVLADGAVVSPAMDAGALTWITADHVGLVQLPGIAEVAVIGLPIVADLTTLDIESGQGAQSLSERQRLVQKLVLRVDATAGIQAGPVGAALADVPMQVAYDAGVPGFSGYLDIEPSGDWNRSGAITVRQARPLPARLLSIAAIVSFGQ